MLFQLQHVQNGAIPKPSFNRVFQGAQEEEQTALFNGIQNANASGS